jgi:hypothetical protein
MASIFDIFGTGDQQAAANAQIVGINIGLNSLNSYCGAGQGLLQQNYGIGANAFNTKYAIGLDCTWGGPRA